MNQAVNNLIYWKLAIFKFLSGLTKVGLLGFVASTTAVTWQNLGGWERFFILASVGCQMLTFAEGFVDQTASRLFAGKPPIGTNGTGHTEQITKPPA